MTVQKLHPSPSVWALGQFITRDGLLEMANFKYVPGNYTPLDRLLNPWWLFIANLVPRWISPNAITLTALTGSLASTILTVLVRQNESLTYLNGHVVFFLAAILQFAYQTLDAVDGKHARNTGQSTPLGAIFDHGCDALAMALNAILVELQTSSPNTEVADSRDVLGSLGALLPMVSFFAGQWEHALSGVMEAAGCTEAQFCTMCVALVAAYGGPVLFQSEILVLVPALLHFPQPFVDMVTGVSLKRFLSNTTVLFAAVVTVRCVLRSLKSPASVKHKLCSFSPSLVQLGFCSLLCLAEIYRENRLVCLTAGVLAFADLNIRMILAGVSQIRFPMFHLSLVPFALASLMGCLVPINGDVHLAVLFLVIGWQVVSIAWLVGNSMSRACAHMGIPMLAPIPARDDKKES
eukprot:TRINITY_DN58441_c0_g1_i1.p1 TRINITY_DN58441_c0_g1~~TRINITY_DN58441_c0_g1_i1.p1  ORF type:complete len:407 (+),score=32.57 TRINITY_DN58441_c0_g1_i1:115-1335(+)